MVGLHHLKLDLVSDFNFAWRTVHNNMLMRRSIAKNNVSRTIPLIEEDQKVALLHAPFKGMTLFGSELAKLQKANMEHGSALTVFPAPAVPPQSYTTKPYTGRGKSFRKGGYSYKRVGWDRDCDRSVPSATISKPSKSGNGQYKDCYSTSKL